MPECVNCRGDLDFNRLIIELATTTEIGGLCSSCEQEEFGILLTDNLWHHDTGCALCPNDGHYALPQLDCLIEYDSKPDDVEYSITADTITLCESHFQALIKSPVSDDAIAHPDAHMPT